MLWPAQADSQAETGKGFKLFNLESKRRIFFKYEKRIRDYSGLEKVFDYFSSTEKDGVKCMTPQDLLAAIVPTYPSTQSDLERAGALDGEPGAGRADKPLTGLAASVGGRVFKQFDTDGDGVLSYAEFLLLCTLLSIPEADVAVIFTLVDLDGNGSVDVEEFQAVMDRLQAMANVHSSGRRNVGRVSKLASHKGPAVGLLISFFGPELKGRLSLKSFMDFLHQLHSDLVSLEFAHYDANGSGYVSGRDLAHALIATADIKLVDRLLDKVDTLPPALVDAKISLRDFTTLHELHHHVHTLTVALDFMAQLGRPVTRVEFNTVCMRLLKLHLTPQVVDIVYALFAKDPGSPDAALDSTALIDVLKRREFLGARQVMSSDASAGSAAGRMWACMRRCGADG